MVHLRMKGLYLYGWGPRDEGKRGFGEMRLNRCHRWTMQSTVGCVSESGLYPQSQEKPLKVLHG